MAWGLLAGLKLIITILGRYRRDGRNGLGPACRIETCRHSTPWATSLVGRNGLGPACRIETTIIEKKKNCLYIFEMAWGLLAGLKQLLNIQKHSSSICCTWIGSRL